MRHTADLIGRILFASFFLHEAVRNITRFKTVMAEWSAQGLTWMTWYFLFMANVFLVLGTTLIVIGYRSGLGAVLLGMVLVPVTLMFHDFWNLPAGPERLEQGKLFLMNLTILGALFIFIGRGPGKISIRKLLASTRS